MYLTQYYTTIKSKNLFYMLLKVNFHHLKDNNQIRLIFIFTEK